jgi:hypothetical protein
MDIQHVNRKTGEREHVGNLEVDGKEDVMVWTGFRIVSNGRLFLTK